MFCQSGTIQSNPTGSNHRSHRFSPAVITVFYLEVRHTVEVIHGETLLHVFFMALRGNHLTLWELSQVFQTLLCLFRPFPVMRVCVTVIIRSCDNKRVALYEKMLSRHHMGRAGLFVQTGPKQDSASPLCFTNSSEGSTHWFKLCAGNRWQRYLSLIDYYCFLNPTMKFNHLNTCACVVVIS